MGLWGLRFISTQRVVLQGSELTGFRRCVLIRVLSVPSNGISLVSVVHCVVFAIVTAFIYVQGAWMILSIRRAGLWCVNLISARCAVL